MAIAGYGGKVMQGTNAVGEVGNWELDIGAADLDATTFDSGGWEESIAGLKNWTVKLDVKWNMSDVGQKALQDAILGGTTVTLDLYPQGTGTSKYSGSVLLTSLKVTTPVDDIVQGSFEGKGTGALTYTP
ncbi:hypothetical protein H1164_03550 [Thermoactinomyces daqus]|uniref:Uncharacterized protein n=1 Tax=Thermoactinomyces daqus TaxID=1329516 RepID=A0A7W2AHM8_9BACL|nr:phage tail tube protein [Thermoactinomyces daqus]MBA4541978.1 hypothetical protein [Thermoactinomyces daqus]